MQDVTDHQATEVVSANLKRLRGDMSYSELGRLAGTSAGAIRDIEIGDRMPGIGLLTRIADALKKPISEFLKTPRK
jgi:transcriptional regulator with XRE-family HTH domain